MYNVFEKGTPEEVGISSKDIRLLLEQFDDEGLHMHSVLIIRHGKVVCEGYYAPYDAQTKHRLYSTSKSFVSGAIGLLWDEGKINLSDKVYTFFPEIPKEEIHPWIREATVENLLTMCSPHMTTYSLNPSHTYFANWAESFFRTPPLRPAGTVFWYDTSASYILDVIVERKCGKSFLEYMKDKMLREIGFSEDAFCIESPEGYAWGGSGVVCTPLDLAKYAYVFLKNGNISGKQFLSKAYVKSATAKQVANDSFGQGKPFTNSGYGYQIWRMPDNGWAFNGMGCQLVYALPDKELMFVCTACNNGRPESEHLIFDMFLNGVARRISDTPLPENKEEHAKLLKMLSELTIYVPKGERHSQWEEKVNGVTYKLEENPMGFRWVRLTFEAEGGRMTYENTTGVKEIPFSLGAYKTFRFPETHYSGKRIGTKKKDGYQCLATGVWTSDNTFLLHVHAIDDYLGNLGMTFGFKDDSIGITSERFAEGFWESYNGFAGGMVEK